MSIVETITSLVISKIGLGDKAKPLVGMLLAWLTGSKAGGLASVIGMVKKMGLGSIFGNSDAKMTGEQVKSLMGGELSNISDKLGLPESTASSAIGSALPLILNKLAPNGVAPATLPSEITDYVQSLSASAKNAGAAVVNTAKSGVNWLLLLLPLLAIAALAFFLLKGCNTSTVEATKPGLPKVQLPEVDKVSDQLKGLFGSATEVVTGVKDVATAEAALPKLTEMTGKFDVVKSLVDKLPAAGKETIKSLINEQMGSFKTLTDKMLLIPGVGEKLKAVIEQILAKFGK